MVLELGWAGFERMIRMYDVRALYILIIFSNPAHPNSKKNSL
jgi:hypothetical protein